MMTFPRTEDELARAGYEYEGNGKCAGPKCGAAIAWYRTPTGKRIPVDEETLQPHWKTCPDARSFRTERKSRLRNKFKESTPIRSWRRRRY